MHGFGTMDEATSALDAFQSVSVDAWVRNDQVAALADGNVSVRIGRCMGSVRNSVSQVGWGRKVSVRIGRCMGRNKE